QLVHSFAILFNPVTPFASEKMLQMLNVDKSLFSWANVSSLILKKNHKLNQPEILFKKIEDSEIEN
ncbi:MAG TPA: hypothetical protein VGK25_06625, partial [Ignavibacteria bacterium]